MTVTRNKNDEVIDVGIDFSQGILLDGRHNTS
jgi:hypothetical protein